MKTKYLLPVMALALTTITFTSCDDLLETSYLGNLQDDEQLKDVSTAQAEKTAAVAGMYAWLKNPYSFFGTVDPRADDCAYVACALGQDLNSADMVNIVSGYDWFSVALEWSDRNPQYANPQMRLGIFYKVIKSANEVIYSIAEDETDANFIAQRGQAKALRAFSYLSLAPYFQFNYVDNQDKPSVPIITSETDPRNNPRASLKDLYAAIFEDLNDAIEDLEGFTRSNKGVIDQRVAYGLRARANLYTENWAAAAADADSAMVGAQIYSYQNIADNPMFNNAEDESWIWGLLLPQELVRSEYASWPSQLASFSSNAYVPFAGIYRSINKLLWDKISTTDVRRAWWLNEKLYSPYLDNMTWVDEAKSITYVGKDIPAAVIANVKIEMPAYTNLKFCGAAGVGAATNEGDWCMMRAEEMLLIKAEALAKAGNEAAGKAALAELMAERDLNYTPMCTNFADEVWLQRRIELWGEGFAMADVMRLKKNVVRFIPGRETNVPKEYQFNIEYGNPWMLLRFVEKEINNNPAIVQNTGGSQPQGGDGANLLDGVTD